MRSNIFEGFATKPIQADHLVVEIRDGYPGETGIVEISDVDPHPCPRLAFAAEGETSLHGCIFESAIPLVTIKLVRLSVIGDEQLGPDVVVFVEQRYAERFGTA